MSALIERKTAHTHSGTTGDVRRCSQAWVRVTENESVCHVSVYSVCSLNKAMCSLACYCSIWGCNRAPIDLYGALPYLHMFLISYRIQWNRIVLCSILRHMAPDRAPPCCTWRLCGSLLQRCGRLCVPPCRVLVWLCWGHEASRCLFIPPYIVLPSSILAAVIYRSRRISISRKADFSL